MKAITALILASSVALSTAAVAEPFNERGPEFSTGVTPTSIHSVAQQVTVVSSGFNDRGEIFPGTTPLRSRNSVVEMYMASLGFNEQNQGALN